MGSPKKTISAEEVEKHAQFGSPPSEIADYFGVSEATLRRRFGKLLAKTRALRAMHLRKFQWKAAAEGSVPMLTFLGKHELGQREDKATSDEKVIMRRAMKRG